MAAQLKHPDKQENNVVDIGGIGGKRLKSLIERIEVLIEQRKLVSDEMREIFAEAKGTGFDPKTMRQIIKLRAMDKQTRQEEEDMLDLYKTALGMLD